MATLTIEQALARATIDVPEAGELFLGLSRNGSYEAAKRGDIPTVRIGRRVVAVVAPLAEKVGLKTTIGRAA